MIKKLIKNYFINVIFILLSIVSFILTDNLENMLFFIVGSVLFSIAFCYKKNNKETKTYDLFTKIKKVIIIVLMLSILILGYLVTISKGLDSLGYAIIFILFLYQLISFCLVNILFRLYYLIRYKQKLDIKTFIKNNSGFLIIISILIIIVICLFYYL